jgi:hypothetical protein
MKKSFSFLVILILIYSTTHAQVLPLKEQARIIDEVLADRLNNLLPSLMDKNKIDMWVIVSREYNEDPFIRTMLPATWLSARRRTILVFYTNPNTKAFKKIAISRYAVGDEIEAQWDMKKFPDQWDALNDLIGQLKPEKIELDDILEKIQNSGIDSLTSEEKKFLDNFDF